MRVRLYSAHMLVGNGRGSDRIIYVSGHAREQHSSPTTIALCKWSGGKPEELKSQGRD